LKESLLIVFSVVLALFLTELFQKLHENKQTHEILHSYGKNLPTTKSQKKYNAY